MDTYKVVMVILGVIGAINGTCGTVVMLLNFFQKKKKRQKNNARPAATGRAPL